MDGGAAGAEGVDAETSMEGYLYKRGALNKAFKRRFFRQQGARLVYFTSPDAKKAQGEIDLTCVITVAVEAGGECPAGAAPAVLVLTTAKRRWVLAADDEDRLRAWAKTLSRVAADVSPVATNNLRNVLAERAERERRALSAEAALGPLTLTDAALSALPVAVAPAALAFGDARQLPIEQPTELVLTLTSRAREKVSFRFYGASDRTRYTLAVTPPQGTLARGAVLHVRCVLVPLCTARVRDKVSVLVWRGALKAIDSPATRVLHARLDMSYESLLSTKLDALEVKMFDPIGEGGYGVVRRGQYRGLDVAVKSLKLDDDITDVLDDFHREVSFLELLRHPNIVNYIGSLHTPTKLSIVTEYCPYGNLCTALAARSLPLSFKIRCLQDTVRGMDFLHQSNIIHRDLKPQNILVVSLEPGSATVAKITDFGTVRDFVTVRSTKRMTLRSKAECCAPDAADAGPRDSMTRGVGTTAYMAPEILNASKYDKPADVYSFSMVIYFLCTNLEPFSDVPAMSSWQFIRRVAEGARPTIPKTVPPECSQLLDIMIHCWNQDPSQRPTFKELNDLFQSMPLPVATPTGPQTPLRDPSTPTRPTAPTSAAAAVLSPRVPARLTASKQYSSMSRLPCAPARPVVPSSSSSSREEDGADDGGLPSKPSRPAPARPGVPRPFRTVAGTAVYSQTCRPARSRFDDSHGRGALDTPQ